ncbi:hypothetical protein CTheo_5581 [Ceratobasidium theobromae]|uniref:Uncharacterized protein n=1 Tax=Ceratobasidium theobromae TaxID=1582974 RepID=A0A5N5QGT8_9AGAM|nr:hypothetical protein CTheo_5581 [Ceratobasidium theobromae]
MLHECKHCRNKSQNLKRDWPVHLIDCNPGRPITTADRLVAFVHQRIPPKDTQTCRDYGFTRTLGFEELKLRILVYHLLIVDLQVKAKTIHQWMEAGILGQMMRETFDSRLSPAQRQQLAYQWFCSRQQTFDRDTSPFLSDAAAVSYNAHRTAWQFIGGNPQDSMEQIATSILNMRPSAGHGLDSSLLHSWVYFGLCGCTTPEEESTLITRYQLLIRFVPFDKFCQAYSTSSLSKLFEECVVPISNRFILDVLGSRNRKSVWFLKDFVLADDETARKAKDTSSIGLDYGFSNCQNVDEVIALRNAYKQVFAPIDADPLALHEACLQGTLFEYVKQKARLKPQQMFRRLMKNPYPLVSEKN